MKLRQKKGTNPGRQIVPCFIKKHFYCTTFLEYKEVIPSG